jgi:hypothetical protein
MVEMIKNFDYLGCLSEFNDVDGLCYEICNERVSLEINKMSANLVKNGVKEGGTTIFINPNMVELIKRLEYYRDNESKKGEHIGSLIGRYLVYVKEFINPNCLIIFNEGKPLLIGTLIINI